MADLTGGCACAKVRFRLSGNPKFTIICQCRDCQRTTGSAHSAQAAFLADGFSITGPVAFWDRTAPSGNLVRKHFCTECGCPLYNTTTRAPDMVMILAGALDDPAAIRPTILVYSEEGIPWDMADVAETES